MRKVASEREFALIDARPVGDYLSGFDFLSFAYGGTLVENGVLVGAVVAHKRIAACASPESLCDVNFRTSNFGDATGSACHYGVTGRTSYNFSMPVPTRGRSGLINGRVWRIMPPPMRARLASSLLQKWNQTRTYGEEALGRDADHVYFRGRHHEERAAATSLNHVAAVSFAVLDLWHRAVPGCTSYHRQVSDT